MIQPIVTQTTDLSEQFLETGSANPQALRPTVSLVSLYASIDINNVMKKTALLIIGITLFVAGYRHIQRYSAYFTAKAALKDPGYATTPVTTVPDDIKQTVAFRLVKPS